MKKISRTRPLRLDWREMKYRKIETHELFYHLPSYKEEYVTQMQGEMNESQIHYAGNYYNMMGSFMSNIDKLTDSNCSVTLFYLRFSHSNRL
jgi:hypothetical protein